MAESVYKVIELIGTSTESWEKAAAAAINRAGKTVRDLRVAEVAQLDLQLNDKGKVKRTARRLESRSSTRTASVSATDRSDIDHAGELGAPLSLEGV